MQVLKTPNLAKIRILCAKGSRSCDTFEGLRPEIEVRGLRNVSVGGGASLSNCHQTH